MEGISESKRKETLYFKVRREKERNPLNCSTFGMYPMLQSWKIVYKIVKQKVQLKYVTLLYESISPHKQAQAQEQAHTYTQIVTIFFFLHLRNN